MSLVAKLTIFLHRIPWLNKNNTHSLFFLNSAQFFGAINDNLFKLLLMFMLIDIRGADEASNVTSLAGAVYVTPFLLFSSTAGLLADRFSKQKLLIGMKVIEIIITALAILTFALKSVPASYILLFLLAAHSAIFGPSKYGIIPEIVPASKVPKANGLITGFTYFAIIVGTFLASFLTEVTNRNFILAVSVCFIFALIGWFSACGIQNTSAQGSKKKFNFLFIREIFYTLVFCREIPRLLPALFGAAFFLFLGGFTQLNIIPFAIQSLKLQEIAGGYLFLSVALGIALGSFIAGKICKEKVELGLPCLSGLALALLLLLLAIFSHLLFLTVIFLFFLGFFGGMFIIPFDAFLQLAPPKEKRGQVIAAGNFLSFTGVLLASFMLFFFSNFLKLSSAQGFAVMSGITFLVTFILILRLASYALPFLFRLLPPFYRISITGEELLQKSTAPLLILESPSKRSMFFLLSKLPNIHFFVPKHKADFVHRLLSSMTLVSSDAIVQAAKKSERKETIPCIIGPISEKIPANSLYVAIAHLSRRKIMITILKKG